MAGNKRERASMREGPLAELFRRTDPDAPDDPKAKADAPEPEAAEAGPSDDASADVSS